MIFLYVGLVLLLGTMGVISDNPVDLSAQFKSVLKKWKHGGNFLPGVPFPPLHTINIDPQQGHLETHSIIADYAINTIHIEGLDNFIVRSLSAKLTRNGLEVYGIIAFPMISVHSDKYSIEGEYTVLSVSGNGPLLINVHDVEAVFYSRINEMNSSVHTANVMFDFNIGEVEVDLANINMYIRWFLNGKKVIESNREEIIKAIIDLVANAINKSKLKITDILSTIKKASR